MLSHVRFERALLKEDGDLPGGAGDSVSPESTHASDQKLSDSKISPAAIRASLVDHLNELSTIDRDIAALNQGGRFLAEAIEGLTKLELPLSPGARLPIDPVTQKSELLDTGLSRYLLALTAHHFNLEERRSNLFALRDVKDAYQAPSKATALVDTVKGLGEQFGKSLFAVASEKINLSIQNNSLIENINSFARWISSDVCGSPLRRPALTSLQLLAGAVISDTRRRLNERVDAICKTYESDPEKGMQEALVRGGEMSMADALSNAFENRRHSANLPSGRAWTTWNESALNKIRSELVEGLVADALSEVFDLEVKSKIAQLNLNKLTQKVVNVADEAEKLDNLHIHLFGAPSPDLAGLPEIFYKRVLQLQPRGWQRTAYSLEELRTIEPDAFSLLRRLATGLRLDNPRP